MPWKNFLFIKALSVILTSYEANPREESITTYSQNKVEMHVTTMMISSTIWNDLKNFANPLQTTYLETQKAVYRYTIERYC